MAMATVNNGVNVQALLDAREALKGAPEAAKFTWRATCKWQNGTHSRSNVLGFFGLGQEQKHKTETSFEADHPEIFASEDQGITPVEFVLVGLASCLTAGIAAVAQNRGIQLRSVQATIEGGMDIQGILGIDSDVRNGFDGITVRYKIDADAFRTMPETVAYLARYQRAIAAPVETSTTVTSVSATDDGYRVVTDRGDWLCRTVVIASGACNLGSVPAFAAAVPASIATLT